MLDRFIDAHNLCVGLSAHQAGKAVAGALARAVPSPADSPPGTKKEQLTPLAQAIRILSGRRSD